MMRLTFQGGEEKERGFSRHTAFLSGMIPRIRRQEGWFPSTAGVQREEEGVGSERPDFRPVFFGIVCGSGERGALCPLPGVHRGQPVISISAGWSLGSRILRTLSSEWVLEACTFVSGCHSPHPQRGSQAPRIHLRTGSRCSYILHKKIRRPHDMPKRVIGVRHQTWQLQSPGEDIQF